MCWVEVLICVYMDEEDGVGGSTLAVSILVKLNLGSNSLHLVADLNIYYNSIIEFVSQN